MYRHLLLSLAGLLVILVSGITAQAQDGGDACKAVPDVVYHSGAVLSMDDDNPQAEAMAVKADTILAVGSSEDMLALRSSGCSTQTVNLDGLTLLPGFNESHGHWFSWREHICSVSEETTYPELEEIMDVLSENGWTSFSELNFGRPDFAPEHLDNALALDSEGKLSVRVNGYWGSLNDDSSLIDALAAAGRRPDTYYSDRVRAPGVKIYVDNPFGAFDILSQEEVENAVQQAAAAGWQVAAHAVNQSAVEKILTAYENVLGEDSNDGRRFRIEHAVKVTDDQLARMEAKGIIASFQLLGPADWPTQSDFGDRFLGDHPEWVMRWQDFVDAQADGLKITGSTDAPFNDAPCNYSPFEIIYQAVTRKGYVDRTLAQWELDQRISIEDALKLLTIDGAYATSEEDEKGSLTPGKWADFVVVSENPLEVATPDELRDIEVLMTVVGGGMEYCNESVLGETCSPTDKFVVDNGVVSASNYLADQTPDLAFDGDLNTNWGAGDFPPQWIQIDLQEPTQIAGIDLVVDQFPAGRTSHEIWARTDDEGAEFELLHRFVGDTETGQVLSYEVPTESPAYRTLMIKSVLSLSWVSWKEITVRKSSATAVDGDHPGLPQSYALMQNYPNPFNPTTTITYELPDRASGELAIFDVYGRRVKTWLIPTSSAGVHALTWDGSDEVGKTVASGVYLYRLSTENFVQSRLMTLLR